MSNGLFDACGVRKYIVPREREAFVAAAMHVEFEFTAFCLTLAITGARISEVLSLSRASIDLADEGIVFRALKQRGKVRFRLVPAPTFLLEMLISLAEQRATPALWSFKRTCAWRNVKVIMRSAGIGEPQCTPKALRHGFAVAAVLKGVPLNVLQRWMGHARLETTAIYTAVLGEEERQLAQRVWSTLEAVASKL
jgi:integrase